MLRALLIIALLLTPAATLAGGLYQESVSTAEVVSYLRAGHIAIDNTYGQAPRMEFTTEQITILPGQPPYTRFLRRVSLAMTDPAERITLYNPLTGAEVGAVTAADLYAMLYSAFVHAELKASAPATLNYTTNGN